jgi:hypothetical protein
VSAERTYLNRNSERIPRSLLQGIFNSCNKYSV